MCVNEKDARLLYEAIQAIPLNENGKKQINNLTDLELRMMDAALKSLLLNKFNEGDSDDETQKIVDNILNKLIAIKIKREKPTSGLIKMILKSIASIFKRNVNISKITTQLERMKEKIREKDRLQEKIVEIEKTLTFHGLDNKEIDGLNQELVELIKQKTELESRYIVEIGEIDAPKEADLPPWDPAAQEPREWIDVQIKNYFKKLVADVSVNLLDKEEDVLRDIYSGAHVVVPGTDLYEHWKAFGPVKRMSSHKSEDQQYALRSQFHEELLFGTVEKEMADGSVVKCTWFQLEKSPVSNFVTFMKHMRDFIRYRWTGKNQGPYGESVHTDRNPILASTAIKSV